MAVLTNLLFVITFGLTVTTELDLQKRIIGGTRCLNDERGYHVRFEFPNASLICGGSLISDRWILTAAHCLMNGMLACLSPHPGPGQQANFSTNYTFINGSEEHDIMLVQLEKPTISIDPIPLPDCTSTTLKGNDVVRIAGYGSNQVDPDNRIVGGEAPVLQCADFTVLRPDKIPDRESNLIAQGFWVNTRNVDTSSGDSGGGVVFNNAIYGVHRGSANGTHAHVGSATFVDVCRYMDWITNITGITP